MLVLVAGLVDKHQASRVEQALLPHPAAASFGNVLTVPFGRTEALLLDGDIMSLEKAPHRGATTRDPLLAHRSHNLVERPIRLLRYQSQQPIFVLFQRRRAASTWLGHDASSLAEPPNPLDHRAGAQIEVFGRFPSRRPRFHRPNRTRTQIN
jgi:hypothetical protein